MGCAVVHGYVLCMYVLYVCECLQYKLYFMYICTSIHYIHFMYIHVYIQYVGPQLDGKMGRMGVSITLIQSQYVFSLVGPTP